MCLCAANLLNIAADLVAIGEGMQLLHAGPATLWAVVAGVAIAVLVMTGSFSTIARVFKLLCLSLLTYVGVLAVSDVPWSEVAVRAVVPQVTWSAAYLAVLVGVLGTTISPYLFFWQSAHRVEELRDGASRGITGRAPRGAASGRGAGEGQHQPGGRRARHDAVELRDVRHHRHDRYHAGREGSHQITSAADAAKALEPLAGGLATVLFALGFIGAGFLAVPVLAGSGSAALAGALGRTWGFSRSPRRAPVFYGLVIGATLAATLLTLLQVNPISLLVVVAVINGVAAAPFLVVVMLIARDPEVMGEHRNGRLTRSLGLDRRCAHGGRGRGPAAHPVRMSRRPTP